MNGDRESYSLKQKNVNVHVELTSSAVMLSNETDTRCFKCCGGGKEGALIPYGQLTGATMGGQGGAFAYVHCNVPQGKKRLNVKLLGPFTASDVVVAQSFVDAIRARARGTFWGHGRAGQRHVVAIVNPASGKGKAMASWEIVASMLTAAGIEYDCLETTNSGHATQLAAMLDIECCSVLAVVGGDGTVHEVVQGLVRHVRAPMALELPLCHVPAGSGNGLAASCGLWTPRHAALAIIKGEVGPLDAVTVVQPRSNLKRLAVLSIQLGMLTDLDLGTEHLRTLLGGERFTYGALREVAKWRSHKAKVAVFLADAPESRRPLPQEAPVGAGPWWPATPLLDAVFCGGGEIDFDLQEAWPDLWTLHHLEAVRFFNIMGPRWAALDYCLNPWGDGLGDGQWEWTTDTCKTRWQALSMIASTQSGAHKDSNLFETHRVIAFAIDPGDKKTTYLTVDGEEFPFEPLYMEVHKGLLNVVLHKE